MSLLLIKLWNHRKHLTELTQLLKSSILSKTNLSMLMIMNIPSSVELIPTGIILRLKRDYYGNPDRFKGRLVARGNLWSRRGITTAELWTFLSPSSTWRAGQLLLRRRPHSQKSWTHLWKMRSFSILVHCSPKGRHIIQCWIFFRRYTRRLYKEE